MLTRALRLSLSCDRAVQPTSQFTSWRSISIPLPHLCLGFSKWCLSLGFLQQNSVLASSLPHTCYMPHQSRSWCCALVSFPYLLHASPISFLILCTRLFPIPATCLTNLVLDIVHSSLPHTCYMPHQSRSWYCALTLNSKGKAYYCTTSMYHILGVTWKRYVVS